MSKTRLSARLFLAAFGISVMGLAGLGCESSGSRSKREPACPCMAGRNKEPVVIQLPPTPEPTRMDPATAVDSSPVSETAEPAKAATVHVYYFHRTMRCETCLQIEAWAKEALEASFSDELARGRVEWVAINFELPENKHYLQQYTLETQALIIDPEGELPPKQLDQIWDLAGDRGRFSAYVENELKAALDKSDVSN